jgi:hypothetical protein
MKETFQLALHKLLHPSHHICLDRRFCGRCGYLEKQDYSYVTQITRFQERSDSKIKTAESHSSAKILFEREARSSLVAATTVPKRSSGVWKC